MNKRLLSSITAVVVFSFSLTPTPALSQDVIAKRLELMEATDKANKVIRTASKEKDYGAVEASAKEIAYYMGAMLELFPKGSISEKSEAHPDIWNRWDEFRDRADKAKAVAEAMRKAAAARDDAQVMAQVKAMGGMASGACGGCHLSFNKKRMKK